jgi:hypothetical protein
LDCYRLANLAEDGGLPWQYIRGKFKRTKIYTHGLFTVWGFVPDGLTANYDPLFTRFKGQDNEKASAEIWKIVEALRDAGLIDYVGHVVEGLSEGSQVIHAYALPNTGEEPERQLAQAAHDAGRAMITDYKFNKAVDELNGTPLLCPVRSHVSDVELIGIVRAVHRPHTRMTAAWAANFLHQCDGHRALFASLRQNAMKSVA